MPTPVQWQLCCESVHLDSAEGGLYSLKWAPWWASDWGQFTSHWWVLRVGGIRQGLLLTFYIKWTMAFLSKGFKLQSSAQGSSWQTDTVGPHLFGAFLSFSAVMKVKTLWAPHMQLWNGYRIKLYLMELLSRVSTHVFQQKRVDTTSPFIVLHHICVHVEYNAHGTQYTVNRKRQQADYD